LDPPGDQHSQPGGPLSAGEAQQLQHFQNRLDEVAVFFQGRVPIFFDGVVVDCMRASSQKPYGEYIAGQIHARGRSVLGDAGFSYVAATVVACVSGLDIGHRQRERGNNSAGLAEVSDRFSQTNLKSERSFAKYTLAEQIKAINCCFRL
jgi:hypothetical protein